MCTCHISIQKGTRLFKTRRPNSVETQYKYKVVIVTGLTHLVFFQKFNFHYFSVFNKKMLAFANTNKPKYRVIWNSKMHFKKKPYSKYTRRSKWFHYSRCPSGFFSISQTCTYLQSCGKKLQLNCDVIKTLNILINKTSVPTAWVVTFSVKQTSQSNGLQSLQVAEVFRMTFMKHYLWNIY